MTKQTITAFDRITGQVMRIETINMGIDPVVIPPEWDWIAGYADPSGQMVDPATGAIIDKPAMAITVSTNRLDGIPEGASIIALLQRHPDPVTGGSFEFDIDHEDMVPVVIQHPLFLEWHGEVPCVPNEN